MTKPKTKTKLIPFDAARYLDSDEAIAEYMSVVFEAVAAQAMDIKVSRRKLSILVGVFAMIAVMFFMKQENFAHALDAWLISIVAWVATLVATSWRCTASFLNARPRISTSSSKGRNPST
jgi:DNA-binding phage protein